MPRDRVALVVLRSPRGAAAPATESSREAVEALESIESIGVESGIEFEHQVA